MRESNLKKIRGIVGENKKFGLHIEDDFDQM